MNLKSLFVMCALVALALPAAAQSQPAGPTDTDRSSTYSKHAGKSTDKKLSTGWTSGKGNRTKHTRDYVRHEKNGKTEHVHAYYHKSRR